MTGLPAPASAPAPGADPTDQLVTAALAPAGAPERSAVLALLGTLDPDTLAFTGWRALCLLDDVLDGAPIPEPAPDPVWSVRVRSLRRRSFAAAALAGRHAATLSEALTERGIAHVATGELAIAWRCARPGDRPVHGVTLLTDPDAPARAVRAAITATGLPLRTSRPWRATTWFGRPDGLAVTVHRGRPGWAADDRTAPLPVRVPALPAATVPVVDDATEVRRIVTGPDDDAGRRLDLGLLARATRPTG